MKFIIIIFSLLFSSQFTFAKFDWNNNCKDAYTAIISLKFQQAKYILDKERQENPENSLVYLIEDYIDYLKIQIGEEQSDFNQLKELKEIRITSIENDYSPSAWHLYSQAEIHLHWAANRLKFGEYFTAAYEIRKAFKLLEKNQVLYPYFLPNQKSLGVLYSLLGSVPNQYQWILSVAGMKGDLNKGFELLEKTINEMKMDPLFSPMLEETYFLYSFLKMNLDNKKDDLENILIEIKTSDNLLLNFSANRLATKIGQNNLAIEILENRVKGPEFYNFIYLDYLIGIGKMNQLDDECIKHFKTYMQGFKGKNYKKSTLMRMSWQAFLNKDFENYSKYKEQINTVGDLQVDADKEAQHFYKRKQPPNISLLKARLYFDGSYFKKCLNELSQVNPLSTNLILYDELDYYYRNARVLEKLNETDRAINYYKKALERGAQQTYFFSAKSALRLGLIYEKKKDKETARIYFKKCIDLKDHLYEQSIEQKAKSGLQRVLN